jgi:hypothetical protein
MKRFFLPALLTACVGLLAALTLDITPDEVHTAARVLGLDFLDDEEVDLMLPDLEDNRQALDSIAARSIPNALSPAVVFNPVLR